MKRFVKFSALMVLVLTIGACAKDDNFAPPPVAQLPNPAPNGFGGGFGGVGACGAPAGTPFRTDGQPYYARLYSYATGSSANAMSVNFVYASPSYRPEDSIVNIGGVANVTFPDLGYLTGAQGGQTSFCVSSVDTFTGASMPGVYDQRSAYISMTMTGQAQIPVYNPYGGYLGGYGQPTGQQFIPTPVQLDMEVQLDSGWMYGTVLITIGQGQYAETYQYDAGSTGSNNYGNYYDPYGYDYYY